MSVTSGDRNKSVDNRAIKSGQRPMSTAAITTNAYAERVSEALRLKWGDHRSSAKEIAGKIGAGVGTVRKWLRGENGPSGEHLLKLVAESDEVWNAVLELSGRESMGADELARMRRALAILEGRET